MRIKMIKASAFKGTQFCHDLAPINLITGGNFAGKTSRLDAIQLALCGFHNALPKTNAGIFSLASGQNMNVAVTFDDGRSMGRAWSLSKSGSVKCEASPLCDTLHFPPVLIDAEAYFALSDRERIRYVFGLVTIPGATDTVSQIVAELKNHKFEENTAETEAAIAKVIPWISVPFTKCATVQDAMESALATLKAEKQTLDASIKSMTGTVRGLTELAQEPPRDVTSELAAARLRLETLVKEQAALEAQIAQAAATAKKRADLAADINGVPRLNQTEFDDMTRKIEVYGRELAAAPPSGVEAARAAAMFEKRGEALANEKMFAAKCKASGELVRQQERTRLATQLAAAQQQALGLSELEAELEATNKEIAQYQKSSRIADSDVGHIAEAIRVLEHCIDPSESVGTAKQLRRILKYGKQCEINTASLSVKLADKKSYARCVGSLTEQLSKLGTDADLEAAKQALDAVLKELASAQVRTEAANEAVAKAEAQERAVAEKRQLLDHAKDRLATLQEGPQRVAELRRQLDALGAIGKYEDEAACEQAWSLWCERSTAARVTVQELDVRNRMFIGYKSEAASKQKAVQARAKLEAEAGACKVALALIEAKQASMVEQAFQSILTVANQVTAGILKAPLCYFEGEIGMKIGGRFVSHKTMSGTETALCYAAISLSLAVSSPAKLLMIDELGRLDAGNKQRVVALARQLVEAGTVEQCIFCDVSSDGYDLAGINHIAL